jgi:hypothetical protein
MLLHKLLAVAAANTFGLGHGMKLVLDCLQQCPLYLFSISASKIFHPLYLLALQQRPLNHILYTEIPILETFFIFYFLYIGICHTIKCIVHILVLLNRLFKVFKWIEDRLEKLYI